MAYSNVPGMNPSTIDFQLATVTVDRGSTTEHQELISLADPVSSLGVARVLGATMASTEFGLGVRIISGASSAADFKTQISGNSTVMQGTSPWVVGGASSVRANLSSTAADNPVQVSGNSTVFQGGSPWVIGGASSIRANLSSTAADNPVQVSGNSTVFQGGSPWAVTPSSTGWASSAGFHFNSSGELQTVAAVTTSTTVNVSSVGGVVHTQPNSTSWASSAGFHFDSSGYLQTVASFTGSTTVNVSSLSGKVLVAPNSTSPEPAFSVRISDGSTWVVDYAQGSTFVSTLVAGGVNFMRVGQSSVSSTDTFVMPWASTAGAQIIAYADSSGAITLVGDASNNAVRVNVVAGSAASTTVNVSSLAGRVGTMPFSTSWASSAGFHFDSSGYLQTVASFTGSTTVNVSSVSGLVQTSPFSTNWASSAGFHFNSSGELQTVAAFTGSTTVSIAGSIRINIGSTAADNAVVVSGNSTVFQGGAPWTIGGNSSVRANLSSTSADNPVTATQTGTWTVNVGTHIQSSAAPSSGSSGLIVRQVIDVQLSAASTSALASTLVSLISSIAGIRAYVTAFSVTSTNQTPAHWGFFSSNATLLWPMTIAALSSGVSGMTMAVSPPGYLFRTAAAEALNFKTAGSTVSGVQLGVSYYNAP